MTAWIAVSRTEHASKHWRPRLGYDFASKQQVVPVILAELTKLLPHYVLGFLQDEDGSYQAVAVVGVGGDRNLYVTRDSQWLCAYVPATLRGYPFALLNDKNQNRVLCIDDGHISDDENHPRLFADDGEIDVRAAETLEFITQCEQNRQQTKFACDALATVNLITPWPITINWSEGMAPTKINGLHRIDEEALNKLDGESLAGLRASGALSLAFAQLFSIAQMEQLTQRAEFLANTDARPSTTDGLGDLFSSEDSGSLNFDALNAQIDNSGKI